MVAVLLWGTGCATSGGPERMVRYRPSVDDRRPWTWSMAAVPVPAAVGVPGSPVPGLTASGGVSRPNTLRTLRRGDKLMIYLRGIPQSEDLGYVVDDAGNINLPLIGSVTVDGKTTAEAERLVERTYVDGGYYQHINVIVVTQEEEYFVRGEVKREGRYPLSGDLTLLQAVATAGGYTDYAKLSRIEVKRGDEVLFFDASRIEKTLDRDPLIKPGDIIVVPRRIF